MFYDIFTRDSLMDIRDRDGERKREIILFTLNRCAECPEDFHYENVDHPHGTPWVHA